MWEIWTNICPSSDHHSFSIPARKCNTLKAINGSVLLTSSQFNARNENASIQFAGPF